MKPYPRGDAYAIAQARQSGMRPSDVVTVVLAGNHHFASPMVYADPSKAYRWDWLASLPVVVLMNRSVDIGATLRDIHAAAPSLLDVIDTDRLLGWLICRLQPLETVRWPRDWVQDWLGDGSLFRDLEDIKARAGVAEAAQQAEMARVEARYADEDFGLSEPLRRAA